VKTLYLDIENTPNTVHRWGMFDSNPVYPVQLLEASRLLCFAAKWKGSKATLFYSPRIFVDRADPHRGMVEAAHTLLSEADVVVTYNGNRHDIPTLNREFALAALNPPAPYVSLDLYRTVKRRFKFPFGKLDYVATELGLGSKVKHEGHGLWIKCMQGDDRAWLRMARYNRQDVRLLESLDDYLKAWEVGHPEPALGSRRRVSDVRGEGRAGQGGLPLHGDRQVPAVPLPVVRRMVDGVTAYRRHTDQGDHRVTKIATVDECERIRATRVEVARLLALPYREKLDDDEYRMRNHLLFEHVKTLPLPDREAFVQHIGRSHPEMDWSILDEPGVDRVIGLAVTTAMSNYPDKLSATYDDLVQSAQIILAERSKLAREKLAKGPNLLRAWLTDRLGDLVRREHHAGEASYGRAPTEAQRLEDYSSTHVGNVVRRINLTGWVL